MRVAAPLSFLLASSVAMLARAADDGAYGRLEGDVAIEARAGAAFAAGGPALAAELGAVYLATAGLYAHYTDGLGSDGADVERSIAVGVTLRPIFWARYARGMEGGPARLDLLIDSFGLGLGVFWDGQEGDANEEPGLELALGLTIPFLEDASGPHIGVRGALRWRAVDLAGHGDGDIIDRGALLSLTLGWHQLLDIHLVDFRDRRPDARAPTRPVLGWVPPRSPATRFR